MRKASEVQTFLLHCQKCGKELFLLVQLRQAPVFQQERWKVFLTSQCIGKAYHRTLIVAPPLECSHIPLKASTISSRTPPQLGVGKFGKQQAHRPHRCQRILPS